MCSSSGTPPAEAPVQPSDCALVVSVPLDRSAFDADLTAGTDFLRQFAARQAARDVDVLWRLYEPAAVSVARTAARASRRGVVVRTRATATDFAHCVLQHHVVTLVAHWRSARFRASDILDPQTAGRMLRQNLRDGSDDMDAEDVALALNCAVDPTGASGVPVQMDDAGAAAAETARQYRMWRARLDLEQRLGPSVRAGGPAVEFADGPMPVERTAAALPATFAGVLDLTVCNSTVLAEEVRKRCRHGAIIANAFAATLDLRMWFYDRALSVMERRRVAYQDAVYIVRRDFRRRP
jgi:hypothetical protein